MSDQWAVPSAGQRAAWEDFRRRCLARAMHDPGPCPEKWPADAAFAARVIEILRANAPDDAAVEDLARAMGQNPGE